MQSGGSKQTSLSWRTLDTDRFRALSILRDDGTIDYSLALEILAVARDDEYLKNAILRFVVQEFREDLRKMLGLSMARIVFKWEPGFEEFIKERKKRRRTVSTETIEYYKDLFKKHLEDKTLSEELVEYVMNHLNKWLRNVFRCYIQHLYYLMKIPSETYGWLMGVVPSRSYKLDVEPYPMSLHQKLVEGGLSSFASSSTPFILCLSHFSGALQEASTSFSITFNSFLLGASTGILPSSTLFMRLCSSLPYSLNDSLWCLLALLSREEAFDAKTIFNPRSRETETQTLPFPSSEFARPGRSDITMSV